MTFLLLFYRFRGTIFFGNSEQVIVHVSEVVHAWQGHLRFLLLDFTMVSAVDSNGRETFARLSRVGDDGKRLAKL